MTIEDIKNEIRWADIGKPFLLKNKDKVISVKIERAYQPENPRDFFDPIGTMLCWHPRYRLGDWQQNNFSTMEDALCNLVYDNVDDEMVIDYIKTGKAKDIAFLVNEDGSLTWNCGYGEVTITALDLSDENKREEFLNDIIHQLHPRDLVTLLEQSPKIVILPIWMYEHSGISLSTAHSYPYNDRWDSSCVGFVYTTKADGVKHGAWVDNFSDDEWHELAEEELRNEVKLYSAYLEDDVYECSYSIWYGLNLDKMQLCARNGRPVYVTHKNDTSYWGIMDAQGYPNDCSNCCVHSWHDGKERRDYLSTLGIVWEAFDVKVDVSENTPEARLADGDGFTDPEYGGYYYGFDDESISDMADFIGDALDIRR